MTDIDYMKMALNEAKKAYEEDEVPIGAIVVCKGRIIARAHNLTEALNDVTAHAEMQAITAAANYLGGKYLNECTLYVTLEPCQMCAGAIVQARIKKVVIGAMNPKAGCAGSILNLLHMKEFNHQVEVVRGVEEEKSRKLMQDFFRELREKKKQEDN